MQQIPDLTTQRLTLRALRPGDAPALTRVANDLEVAQWLTRMPHPYTAQDADQFISGVVSDARRVWGLCPQGGDPVGVIGLQGEFGYWLARSHWRQGLMFEAAQAVLTHHFDRSDATLLSGHHAGNTKSAGLLSKLGFAYNGVIDPAMSRATARPVDIHRMILTQSAWRRSTSA